MLCGGKRMFRPALRPCDPTLALCATLARLLKRRRTFLWRFGWSKYGPKGRSGSPRAIPSSLATQLPARVSDSGRDELSLAVVIRLGLRRKHGERLLERWLVLRRRRRRRDSAEPRRGERRRGRLRRQRLRRQLLLRRRAPHARAKAHAREATGPGGGWWCGPSARGRRWRQQR